MLPFHVCAGLLLVELGMSSIEIKDWLWGVGLL